MSPRISAIVISYNRLAFLKRCVATLRSQTRGPDDILIADGDSRDGTLDWLATQPDLITLKLPNYGSAGSIAHGMTWAMQHGSDWVWLFDDDVIAEPDALAQLLTAVEKHPEIRVFNSLSLAIEHPTLPAASALRLRTAPQNYLDGRNLYTKQEILAQANADGLLDSVGGQLYQGTLIHRSVIERVGVPLEILFTRGDEVEYGLRMMRAGYHIYIVTSSIVKHPHIRVQFLHIFGRTLPCEPMGAFKRYYNMRNSIYIRKTYYGQRPFWGYVARRLIGVFITELFVDRTNSWRERAKSLSASLRGLRDGLALARTYTPEPLSTP